MFHNLGWGNHFAYFFAQAIEALIIMLIAAVAAGLIFLLVRFLLVATRAAQLYVAKHDVPRAGSATGTGTVSTEPAAAPVASAPSTPATTSPTTSKPATKPRTPKTPPSA